MSEHLPGQLVSDEHRERADQSRSYAQGEDRGAEESHGGASQVEEEHFLAGVGFDEEGVGFATGDVGGQDGVGGFIVVQAGGNVIQLVDSQEKRYQEDNEQ